MKRPSFQFYPADWKNNSKLRRCSEAARGAWVDVLCLLHDSDEYGVCRWPAAELARAAGVPLRLINELSAKDVLKGSNKAAPDYVFTPRHAGKDGAPVVLVEAGDGPCWYCSRFVRDEYVRQRRGNSSRFSEDNQPTKDADESAPNQSPKGGFGARQGDGPTSTSTSTSSKPKNKAQAPSFVPLVALLEQGVEQQTAEDWLSLRKTKRAAVTATVLANLVRESAKAGLTLESALTICCTRGWAGFDAAWLAKDAKQPGGPVKFDGAAYVNRNRKMP